MGQLFVNRNKSPEAKKMTFSKFSLLLHIYSTFLFLPKFHIFSRLEKSWGDKEYENFRLKWRRRPKKWFFFGFFFLSCTSTHWGTTFLFLLRFHIFSRSEKSWGQGKKLYIEQRRTNERRRTTNYMDDHNTPLGFSESSG